MANDLCYTFQVHSLGMLEPEMEMGGNGWRRVRLKVILL